jgi:hypothetical protein
MQLEFEDDGSLTTDCVPPVTGWPIAAATTAGVRKLQEFGAAARASESLMLATIASAQQVETHERLIRAIKSP